MSPTRHPRPPRPSTPLDGLLDRLQDEMQQLPIDPGLSARVEARIRTDPVRPPAARARPIPRWAAVAAAVLLTLVGGASTRSTQEATLFAPPQTAPPPPPEPPSESPPPERARDEEEKEADR